MKPDKANTLAIMPLFDSIANIIGIRVTTSVIKVNKDTRFYFFNLLSLFLSGYLACVIVLV